MTAKTDPTTKAAREAKRIMVCDACLTASCWYGEYMCHEPYGAGTVIKTVKELRKLKKEHSENWGVKKLLSIYGSSNPFPGIQP